MIQKDPVIDEPALIVYYCRACEKIVEAKSKGNKKRYSFSCPECGGDCSYGTAHSMIHFLKIKESSDNGKILLDLQKKKLAGASEKEEQETK